MLSITGKLVYNPKRKNFKKLHKMNTLIVEFSRSDLDIYYQYFLRKKFGDSYFLQRPLYGCHCTVVKGDEFIKPEYESYWGKYNNRKIELIYNPEELYKHWKFWSLGVISNDLNNIRNELGLNKVPFHITIGREL